jgi:transposase
MIPLGTKVYFARVPADFRCSFDGLSALSASALGRDPVKGGLFVFLNKRANQVRILFRDPHGWCIVAKRLDRGRFRRPSMEAGVFCWETDVRALMAFLDDMKETIARGPRRPAAPRRPRLEIV